MQKQQLQNWAVAVVLGIIGTIQYHLAQFTSRFDTVFGDRGDVRGVVYFCEHWHRWLIGKADLVSPAIFYPTKHTLAYSDYLVGYAIPYSFARLLGFGMFSSIEIVIILFTFLNYFACYLLLKHVLKFSLLPACAGAMFFAFNSPKFHQLPHLQLQYVVLLPLIFACIVLFVRKAESDRRREASGWLVAAVTLFILQATTAFYYAWFLGLWILLFTTAALALPRSRRFLLVFARREWRVTIAAAVVLLVGLGLFVLSYLPGLRVGQWYRYDFVLQMIPSWWSLIWMGDGNFLWGWLSKLIVPNPRPSTWNELRVGFGLVATLAWIGGTIWIIRRIRAPKNIDRATSLSSATPAFLVAAVLATTVFFLIGINYANHSPWFLIYDYFPAGKAIRAVARYVIFLTLPMAIVFAFLLEVALEWAAKQRSLRSRKIATAVIILIAALGVFEQFGVFKVGAVGFSKKAEDAYLKAMVAKLPGDCAAFYIAPGTGKHSPAEYQYDGMMISIVSGVPSLNASMSQFPPGWGLYFVNDPNYEARVQEWIASQGIKGKVCRLEIGPQVEAFDMHALNALDDPTFFITQQYRDFAGREPTQQELQKHFQSCSINRACDRAAISLDIFRGTGFEADGGFVYDLYQIAFGRAPRYEEFTADLAALRTSNDRLTFLESFVTREEFTKRYASLADADYVNKLAENSAGSLSDATRQSLSTDHKSPPQTLLAATESQEVARKFADHAFVALHYFGYLRRDPDQAGYDEWLRILDKTRDAARITEGFVNSLEYRQRFAS